MELVQAVLLPFAMYIGRYFSNFITEFKAQFTNIIATLDEIGKCLLNLKTDLGDISMALTDITREYQSSVQDMNAMSKMQISSESKLDSLGQQLAEIKGGLNVR